jgi:lipopolysaccharide export system permease protein
VSIAETAVKEEQGWRLNKIQGTKFGPLKTEVLKTDKLIVPSLLEPEILETASVKHPERLSLMALYRTIEHRSKNELNAKTYELAFWRKIFQPGLIIIMVFIAVPFVFGPLRSSGMGYRIFTGILVAYVFHTFNSMFSPLAMVYQVPPIIAVLLPLMLFASVGFALLKRVK